jgi:uncharacterized iron-regulated membrane protein
MKTFRKILFWCHLTAGVAAGLVILMMSATGVLLAYEKQMIEWADARTYSIAPPTSGLNEPLRIEALLAKARQSHPDAAINAVTLRSDPRAAAGVSFAGAGPGGGQTIYFDPYTGRELGEGAKGAREFFRVVMGLHRWFALTGENRMTGRAITGACNLAFLFIVLSGFYLWWPRALTRERVKQILWFRRGLPSKARDFNWHNVIGFWSLAPLFVIVLSGAVISYTWMANLMYRVVGEQPPAPRSSAPAAKPPAASREVSFAGMNPLWERAAAQAPDWRAIALRLPAAPDAPAVFTIYRGYAGEPHKRGTLTLDARTGAVLRWEPFAELSRGRRLLSILRFAHTGEIGGLAGQTLAGLVSLGAVVLVWTGLAMAWRRLAAWRGRRARVAAEAVTV